MTTRFRTHAFFLCFVPFAMLLAGSLWMVQRFVQSTVRDGLHAALRESQAAMAKIHANGDLQNSRSLRLASENSALKAGMQQLLTDRNDEAAVGINTTFAFESATRLIKRLSAVLPPLVIISMPLCFFEAS